MAVQGLSEPWGLSGSPGEFPGQSGTPWESRDVWESLGIGDQRSGQCMEETPGLRLLSTVPLQQNTFCEHFPIYLSIQKLMDCQGEETLLKLIEPM